MYAIITTGGKQYKVSEGDVIRVEKLGAEPGMTVDFDKVLMIRGDDKVDVGSPYLKGRKVCGRVIAQGRDKKVEVVKFRRRKHYLRRSGHRQDHTQVRITAIT